MWLFWICFVIFLTQPAPLMPLWPLPTVDRGGWFDIAVASLVVDITLIALFGLQRSVMARPAFKAWLGLSEPFERVLFVHMANVAMFALILFWQPLPNEIWLLPRGWLHNATWMLFAIGWLILFAGAHSFGILELIGVRQMHRWASGEQASPPQLKTGFLYRWLRHPNVRGRADGSVDHTRHDGWPSSAGSGPDRLCPDRHALNALHDQGPVGRVEPALDASAAYSDEAGH